MTKKRPWYLPKPTWTAEPEPEAVIPPIHVEPPPAPVPAPAPPSKTKAKAPKAAKPTHPRRVSAKSPPAPATHPDETVEDPTSPPAIALKPEEPEVKTDPVVDAQDAGDRKKGRRLRVAIVDGPDPIDIFVGNRIRQRRVMLGVSQQSLGRSLGLTFQQVQKQERGKNRVSCSALWRISEALDVPVSFFFDGVKDLVASEPVPLATDEERDAGPILAELRLLGQLRQIPEGARDTIVKLIGATAKIED